MGYMKIMKAKLPVDEAIDTKNVKRAKKLPEPVMKPMPLAEIPAQQPPETGSSRG